MTNSTTLSSSAVGDHLRRKDPIFGLPTPLLFAHRGGAAEVEESTIRGFRHAIDVGADVLELDIHRLLDGEFVVWHGPELSNVYIDGLSPRPRERGKKENSIHSWRWSDLKDIAWVAAPVWPADKNRDLSNIPRTRDRMPMTLAEFMQIFPDKPLNIEMKETIDTSDIPALIEVLDAYKGDRPVLIVSLKGKLLRPFAAAPKKYEYGMGFSMLGALGAMAAPFDFFSDLRGCALQTSYKSWASPPRVIERVRRHGGATHVFLTGFWFLAPALDEAPGKPTREQLVPILDRGVDGIMTDRPKQVRPLIDAWLERADTEAKVPS